MWVTGSGLVPAPALYWPHVLPAPSPWQRPQQEWDYHPASARRRDHWLEEMETCISIALGKRPISHSGFDLQASSPSCMARWAGHSPQLSALSPFLAAKTTPALSQTGLSA